jgi:hypothetical protein
MAVEKCDLLVLVLRESCVIFTHQNTTSLAIATFSTLLSLMDTYTNS